MNHPDEGWILSPGYQLAPAEAFAEVAPQLVLLDAQYKVLFESTRTPELEARGTAFWNYMHAHNAQRVATVTDLDGALPDPVGTAVP